MGSRPDKRFGRYEVVAEIGRGAMGAVYKALDPQINRFVAIKAISAISQSPEEEREYRERFFHEAQAAGCLLHPGIVAIFDVGEEGETRTPYIVMEYVSGQSLSGLLSGDNSRLPLELALRLTEEIALALDCAHAQGVVHRDIKPANVLLSEEGHAKIADFGIAKINLANVTLPGHTLGTPAYMSPEQVDGLAVDGRSDLFSLGVILYNMVTGHRPFQGTSAVTVCYKVANASPLPATSFDLDLPAELDPVITRALAKTPGQRFQRGADFARAVRELRERLTQDSSTVPADVQTARTAPAASAAKASLRVRRKASERALAVSYVTAAAAVLVLGAWIFMFGIPFHRTQKVSAALNIIATARPAQQPASLTPASAAPPSVLDDTVTAKDRTTPKPAPPAPKSQLGSLSKLKSTAKPQPALVAVSTSATPVPSTPVLENARLKIEVQHHFAEGKLTLWVDEKLVYSTDLHGEAKTRLAIFHGVQGAGSAEVDVPAGAHTLRVNGKSTATDFDESKTISADFATGSEKTLRVDFQKNNREMRLVLR